MANCDAGAVHAFLAGCGTDWRQRSVDDLLAMSDDELESCGDFVQWLFPLMTEDAGRPDAPVLDREAVLAIRQDDDAQENLVKAAARMRAFLTAHDGWLKEVDHNHGRIERIVGSLSLLVSQEAGGSFHRFALARNALSGSNVDTRALVAWNQALRQDVPRPDMPPVMPARFIGAIRRLVGAVA